MLLVLTLYLTISFYLKCFVLYKPKYKRFDFHFKLNQIKKQFSQRRKKANTHRACVSSQWWILSFIAWPSRHVRNNEETKSRVKKSVKRHHFWCSITSYAMMWQNLLDTLKWSEPVFLNTNKIAVTWVTVWALNWGYKSIVWLYRLLRTSIFSLIEH